MTVPDTAGGVMRCACLVDTTRCIGCRSCQVACKQSNNLQAEGTRFFAGTGGYQNPTRLSPRTFTFISFHELDDRAGRPVWIFAKHQCMHCENMYCATVCAAEVFHKTATGIVACEADKCVGCAACVDECPFGVPTIDYWDLPTPYMRKCSFCIERQEAKASGHRINGKTLPARESADYEKSLHMPACAKACPSGAIQFGPRQKLIAEARRRIAAEPDRYVDHIYGLSEAGGTGWLYLASVPFEQLGLPVKFKPFEPGAEMGRMGANVRTRGPLASIGSSLGAVLAGIGWLFRRRNEVRSTPRKDVPT